MYQGDNTGGDHFGGRNCTPPPTTKINPYFSECMTDTPFLGSKLAI